MDGTYDESVVTKYLSFQELQPLRDPFSQEEVKDAAGAQEVWGKVVSLSQSKDWKDNFEALNLLRTYNKFDYPALCGNLVSVAPFLGESVDSLRSNMMKNSLLFLQELFGWDRPEPQIDQMLAVVAPALVIKCGYEKQFIAKDAKNVVDLMTEHGRHPQTVQALQEGCLSKNTQLGDFSSEKLAKLIKNTDEAWLNQHFATVVPLVRQLKVDLENKRLKLKKNAEDILKHLKEELGEQGLAEVFKAAFPDNEAAVKTLQSVFEAKQKKAPASTGFRSFLKTKKQETVTEQKAEDDAVPVIVQSKFPSKPDE